MALFQKQAISIAPEIGIIEGVNTIITNRLDIGGTMIFGGAILGFLATTYIPPVRNLSVKMSEKKKPLTV